MARVSLHFQCESLNNNILIKKMQSSNRVYTHCAICVCAYVYCWTNNEKKQKKKKQNLPNVNKMLIFLHLHSCSNWRYKLWQLAVHCNENYSTKNQHKLWLATLYTLYTYTKHIRVCARPRMSERASSNSAKSKFNSDNKTPRWQ